MIFRQLEKAATSVPAENGLWAGDEFLSYADALLRVRKLAAGFVDQGLKAGDPVAILLPNSPEMFVVSHALLAIGAIILPLSQNAAQAECANALQKSGAVALVAQPQCASLASALVPALAPKRHRQIFWSGQGDAAPTGSTGEGGRQSTLQALARSVPTPLPKVSGSAPAAYLLSSGSTGMPKIVVHTQAALVADGKRCARAWRFETGDTIFNMLPSNFAMGLFLGLTGPLMVGASVVYWHDPRPLILTRRAVLETIMARNISVMGAVPAMYETLAQTPGDFDLKNVRLSFVGGAPLARAIFEDARKRLGLTLRQSYGLTEAIMVAHNENPDIEASWRSVGRPVGDARFKIGDFDTGLPEGVGELMIKSSSLMRGYLGDKTQTAASFRDGWLLTGDLARKDEEGNYYIVGRKKLLIEVMGFKIDPIEVEQALLAHEKVGEAVVIGVGASSRQGQRLKAFIVPTSEPFEPSILIEYLHQRLSAHKVPKQFEFRSSLPKSDTGKILRGALQSDE